MSSLKTHLPSLHPEFLSGRRPVDYHPDSMQYIHWWNEQIERSLFGFSYKGRKVSGSYYFYLNFFRMEIMIGEGATKRREYLYPYPCNTDEAVFEAMEDCHRHWQTFMLFTSGGTGKTSFVSSYIQREWTFFPRSYSLVTASIEKPAGQMMKYIEDSIDAAPDAISHDRYPYNRFNNFTAATRKRDGTVDAELSYNSVVEKIVFGDNSGATRSKRPTLMAMEEIGNWVGGASLLDCYNASIARGQIGGEASCFYMMIGTGGHTRNNVIAEVEEMITHAPAYNLYLCDPWKIGERNIFFIPCFKKAWGFYEETGVMDEVGARAKFETRRELKKDNPKALLAEKREFPFTLKECFLKENASGLFHPAKLEYQERRITDGLDTDSLLKPKRGRWMWNHKKQYPDFVEQADGPVWIYEEPHQTFSTTGSLADAPIQVPDKLYIAGYDGIDFSDKDSVTINGSKGALMVKKRTTPMSLTNNIYVCRINWRPEGDINDLYEQVLFCCIAYNCKVNIEYSKIGIKKYFETTRQGWRLLRRPKSMMGNSLDNQVTGRKVDLIGTQPTPANISYGIGLLQTYVFHYYQQLFDLEFIGQLRDFDYSEKGKYDMVMAALWAEVADEAEPIYLHEAAQVKSQTIGWYVDPQSGYKVFGILPDSVEKELRFARQTEPSGRVYNPFLLQSELYQSIA